MAKPTMFNESSAATVAASTISNVLTIASELSTTHDDRFHALIKPSEMLPITTHILPRSHVHAPGFKHTPDLSTKDVLLKILLPFIITILLIAMVILVIFWKRAEEPETLLYYRDIEAAQERDWDADDSESGDDWTVETDARHQQRHGDEFSPLIPDIVISPPTPCPGSRPRPHSTSRDISGDEVSGQMWLEVPDEEWN
ncbi:hypothetical protein F5Y15DRAFT_273373 [Xylariaceae sp. FL0016]|nr:hypothetical protein F5Y15DRAFT_273373 [Xylariaceae sp. FL0016]